MEVSVTRLIGSANAATQPGSLTFEVQVRPAEGRSYVLRRRYKEFAQLQADLMRSGHISCPVLIPMSKPAGVESRREACDALLRSMTHGVAAIESVRVFLEAEGRSGRAAAAGFARLSSYSPVAAAAAAAPAVLVAAAEGGSRDSGDGGGGSEVEDATAEAETAAACAGVLASGCEQDAAAEEEELAWGPHLQQQVEGARLRWEGLAYGVRGKGAILQQGQHGQNALAAVRPCGRPPLQRHPPTCSGLAVVGRERSALAVCWLPNGGSGGALVPAQRPADSPPPPLAAQAVRR